MNVKKKMKKMKNRIIIKYLTIGFIALIAQSCAIPVLVQKKENKSVPTVYSGAQDSTNTVAMQDSTNSAKLKWKEFFSDPYLNTLIDSALKNNQEWNIMQQEIGIAKNEVLDRKGAYLPFVNVGGLAGIDRVGRYTSQGASDAADDITPGEKVPENLGNFAFGISTTWEIDIWRKLRNARDAASARYLATVEGQNFMVTQLVTEIAGSYYELMALDNMLEILDQTIEIQQNALKIVQQQKIAARVTELAVRRFEAEVLKNQSRRYYILQEIVELSNQINFLVGRYPQTIQRNSQGFSSWTPDSIYVGVPSQLLENRPDIKKSEYELAATKLDIKVAKADFYPSLKISASLGMQVFNPKFFIDPASIIYSVLGELVGPIINRNAIKAAYLSANSRQIKAVYNYERTILNAFVEVANQVSMVDNLTKSYDLKSQQVQALTESITISSNLFKSAKADYMEVLLTQRDALEARMELTETKMHQMHASLNLYKALGGGWRF